MTRFAPIFAVWLAAAPALSAEAARLPALCEHCAVVSSVRSVNRSGEAPPKWMLGGASAHRLGHRARDDGPAPGSRGTVWITTVTLKNGKPRSFEARANPGLRAGDVVVIDDALLRRHIPEPAAR